MYSLNVLAKNKQNYIFEKKIISTKQYIQFLQVAIPFYLKHMQTNSSSEPITLPLTQISDVYKIESELTFIITKTNQFEP